MCRTRFHRLAIAIGLALLALAGLGSPALAQSDSLNILEVVRQRFIRPRVYPDSLYPDSLRERYYDLVKQYRFDHGVTHGTVVFSDTALMAATQELQPCAWTSVGPTNLNGRVTSITVDPSQPSRIFATTVGGIWRSEDDGRRWHRVSDGFRARVLGSVVVSPTNSSVVFAGAGDPNHGVSLDPDLVVGAAGNGIWRSLSGGGLNTWTKVSGTLLDDRIVYRLRMDPEEPNTVYAATDAGLFVGSPITGTTMSWTLLAGMNASCSDVLIDIDSSGNKKIYAGVYRGASGFGKGIWKYNGTSWGQRNGSIGSEIGAIALAMDPSNPQVLYAKISNSSDGSLKGVYKSTTGAESPGSTPAWNRLPGGDVLDDSQGAAFNYDWYNSVIEVDPNDSNRLLAGGLSIYMSKDAGVSWEQVTPGKDNRFGAAHDDQHAIAFYPKGDAAHAHIVMIGNDGGIDRSSDLTASDWHWNNVSHGMTIGELYSLGSRQATATGTAAGSQDNGSDVTFGNRTWYHLHECDAFSVAMDAKNACTIYETCNGDYRLSVNPVEGTMGAAATIVPIMDNANVILGPPFATHPSESHVALAVGTNQLSKRQRVYRTADAKNWGTLMTDPLPADARVSCLAMAGTAASATELAGEPVYAGVLEGTSATIRTYSSGGWTSWAVPAGFSPNQIVVQSSLVAFAALGGSAGGAVALTEDGGSTWRRLTFTGFTSLPPLTALALDPNGGNDVYAGTPVGPLKGQWVPGAPGNIDWNTFDRGLPEAVEVNDLWANRQTKTLTLATMGFGAFEFDVSRPLCQGARLVVRDNVFDRGTPTSPTNLPDPEHPIPDGEFYKPDDVDRVHWWSSSDIRVYRPVGTPIENEMTKAGPDHVELESCAIRNAVCPPGTMIDSSPAVGESAYVCVQVTNRGLLPASNVRVMALWAPSGTTANLPSNFWTSVFPPPGTACALPSTTSPWQPIDTEHPCQFLPVVSPDIPEVAVFRWKVPVSAPSHCCLIAVVDSDDDPTTRGELRPWMLVPNERHAAQRNIHVINGTTSSAAISGILLMQIKNTGSRTRRFDLSVLRSGMPRQAKLQIVLNSPVVVVSSELLTKPESPWRPVWRPPSPIALDRLEWLEKIGLGRGFSLEFTRPETRLRGISIPPHTTARFGLLYDTVEPVATNQAWRFSLVTRIGAQVIGGDTYLLRGR